ncbi:Ig-like domain-containing protein [Brevibacillus sp. HB2.2]|uniref:Ig-like domain-containing protein n=1 Tax=Brevibacillus sp. HB2.2 TaxID=2738846 RepID=UPI00156B783B|nr:Ig-like domain-containing protein [Brevibacillus sp. HB2.2]NRS49425.1 Ig-like domain-containing protein [Brevibacillus sp. HB2.2]
MNKKVVLSVLSTTLVASVAASAFAAPKDGIYIGGNIKKYYSTDVLFEMTPQAKATYASELNAMASDFNNVVFVDYKGNGASIEELFTKGSKVALGEPLKKADFADLYKVVNKDGSSTATEDARSKVDGDNTGDLKVESVSANNLRTIAIKFNKAVDQKEAEQSTKVKLFDGTASKSIKRELSEDGKTLYLIDSVTGKFDQGKSYKVTVDGLKAAEGTATVNFETTVKALDTEVPVAKSATLTSPKTLELQFSEPVNITTASGVLTDLVQIDGINVFASSVKQSNDGTVTITLGNPVTVGAHKVKVSNLKDYAGLPLETKEFDVTLGADTTPPAVTGVEVVNASTIKVTFSEVVDESTVQAGNPGLYVKVPGKPNNDVTVVNKKSSTVYEMTLQNPLDLAAVVQAELAYNNIKDNYGNEVKEEKTFKFTAVDDVTSPTVAGHTVDSSNNVEITFSKAVKNVDKSDFLLLDKDGKVVNGGITNVVAKSIDNQASDKTFVIQINDALNKSGVYSVKVVKENNIVDKSIRENKLGEATFAITLADKQAPEMISAKWQVEIGDNIISDGDSFDSKITIIFNESMDIATLANKANYLLGDKPLSDISAATVTTSTDGKSVVITYNKAEASPEQFGSLKVLAVKDVAGNTLKSGQLNQNLSSLSAIYGAYNPSVAFNDAIQENAVQLVAKNKVKVSAKTGHLFTAVDPNKVTVVVGNTLEAQVTSVNLATDKKSVELTLSKELKPNATSDGTATVKLKADKDAFVFEGAIATDAGTSADLVDKVKPTLVVPPKGKLQTDDKTDTITLEFDEVVTGDDAAVKQALVIKNTDGSRIPTAKYSIDKVQDNKLEITFSDISIDGAVTVELLNNIAITDVIGNYASDFAAVSSDAFVVGVIDDAVKAVEGKIAKLPAVDALKVTDETDVKAARADFDKLTAAQKALVKNEDVLKAAEAKIADLKKAVALEEATKAVETAETSKKQSDVDAAKTLVAALEDGTAKADLQKRIDEIVVAP